MRKLDTVGGWQVPAQSRCDPDEGSRMRKSPRIGSIAHAAVQTSSTPAEELWFDAGSLVHKPGFSASNHGRLHADDRYAESVGDFEWPRHLEMRLRDAIPWFFLWRDIRKNTENASLALPSSQSFLRGNSTFIVLIRRLLNRQESDTLE
jgi:hypothetical protein